MFANFRKIGSFATRHAANLRPRIPLFRWSGGAQLSAFLRRKFPTYSVHVSRHCFPVDSKAMPRRAAAANCWKTFRSSSTIAPTFDADAIPTLFPTTLALAMFTSKIHLKAFPFPDERFVRDPTNCRETRWGRLVFEICGDSWRLSD